MRYLGAAAFKKTKTKLGKRIEHAAEHQVSDSEGILHGVAERAPKTIAASGIVARHAPAADDRAGVHRMKNDRNSELLALAKTGQNSSPSRSFSPTVV